MEMIKHETNNDKKKKEIIRPTAKKRATFATPLAGFNAQIAILIPLKK